MDVLAHLLERIQEDAGFVLYRARVGDGATPILLRVMAGRTSDDGSLARLEHELAMRAELDRSWAILPLTLGRHEGRPALVLEDPGGQPLDRLIGKPSPLLRFLELAVSAAGALRGLHGRSLIHKDVRPGNLWVGETGQVRITGFGVTTRQPRERQTASPNEVAASTLPYMAPEQTGRVNRSVDARSDLYSLGITFYEMLVGSLPFAATDALEWFHCHTARQPSPPSMRMDGVPPVVEAIILKLIAKDPADRYQTAAGVEHDLCRCLVDARQGRSPAWFELASHDVPKRLQIPEKLYNREAEISLLVSAFERVQAHGQFELFLVSGYSGVGKSSLVNEFRRTLYSTRGLFASGKSDHYKQQIPYATLAEAFQRLLREILGSEAGVLERWRTALAEALGSNGQLMVDLLPELALILGEQSALAAVPPQEAKNRFNLVFRRFVGVFARPDHPLVLFLDDLQWLDVETLDLLKQLTIEDEIPCLMLIGSYRSNEVSPSHALGEALGQMAIARRGLSEIRLLPLSMSDIGGLVADALRADGDAVRTLAELVFEKTQGNPFFVLQFLASLSVDGLLEFDGDAGVWRWDLERIRRSEITENVADLLATKLVRYGPLAVSIIKRFACLGSVAGTSVLSALTGTSEQAIDDILRTLVADGLLHRAENGYVFSHDGVREAAYALVPDDERTATHLEIGRLLSEGMETGQVGGDLFAVVGQLNRGSGLIGAAEERVRLAELNLAAGRRAVAAAAYETALAYFAAGRAMLPEDSWATDFRTTFELEFHQADCKFMTGEIAFAEERLAMLAGRCSDIADHALVVSRQMGVYCYLGQLEAAIELAVACAARMGEILPLRAGQDVLEREYRILAGKLEGRTVESIGDLPRMTDPHWLQVMDVLESLLSPAGTHDPDLMALVVMRMVNLSLDHGLTDESSHAFGNLSGMVLGWRFGDFETARSFARLSLRLADSGYDRYASRIYAVISGTIGPWSLPLRDCFNLAMRSLEMGRQQGGVTYAGYAWSTALTAALDGGKPLSEVYRLAEAGLATVRKLKFALAAEFLNIILQMAGTLRGMSAEFGSLSNDEMSEVDYETHLGSEPYLWHALVRFRLRKLQLQYYRGDYAACLAMTSKLDPEIGRIMVFERAEYRFFSALSRCALLDTLPEDERAVHSTAVGFAHEQLSDWAKLCPHNFASRASLVGAEIARIEKRELDAQRLYEDSIRLAGDEGSISVEALSFELAARFYAARGYDTIAQTYMRNARASYARWGADGKVAQLDTLYPDLWRERTGRAATAVWSGAQFPNLDLSAIVEIYQTVSGEIVFDRLIEQLMVTVVEQAGAVRSLMLFPRDGGMRIVAEAETAGDAVKVVMRSEMNLAGQLPTSILNYVTRTQDTVILDDAMQPNAYSSDAFLVVSKPRSILCLPLIKQGRLVAVLYLENALASHMFTPSRLAVLQLLASQAAISIENAELLLEAEDARDEARQANGELKRSFDMIPALAWRMRPGQQFEFANKQWHDYTGINKDDAALGQRWWETYHPDDLEKIRSRWEHLREFGVSGQVEARIRRFDGEYRRFLVRVTPMRDETGVIAKWHGTGTDIEDLKQAEQAQEALARVSRITALGELTVSIAHEVNQPLMAIVTNAASCLRWLSEDRLDLVEARLAAERIVHDGHRAGDVIASIRALARKSPTEMAALDVNEVVHEVLQLTRDELERNAIAVETQLATDAGLVFADGVQMQQVILNLVMNGIEAMSDRKKRVRRLRIVSTAGEAGYVNVSVADTGIGLDPALTDRIFEAFFTTKPGGVGIGLSICRSIVETHHGRISVRPNKPRGTVFEFSLPAAAEDQFRANAHQRKGSAESSRTRPTSTIARRSATASRPPVD